MDTQYNLLAYGIERLISALEYQRYLRQVVGTGEHRKEYFAQRLPFTGYPANHDYFYYQGALIPSLKLFERHRKIKACFPEQCTSLLDISCCRGFYVFDASLTGELQTVLGVDVVDEFVDYCRNVKTVIGDTRCRFMTATLDQIHAQCLEAKQQFDVTLFTGSYHYFYWGSAQNPMAYNDHDAILGRIAAITRSRTIFSGRLEVAQLADYPKRMAAVHRNKNLYDTEHFLAIAEKYFTIQDKGFLGRSKLLLLDKR